MTIPSRSNRSVARCSVAAGAIVCVLGCVSVGFSSCNPSGTSAPVGFVSGGPATPLTAEEVFRIIQRAVFAIDQPDMHVAVTDRTGDILGVYSTSATSTTDVQDADNIAVSLARTTSFFSNSQAPLSSRTVETLGSFHFPPTFAAELLSSQVPAGGSATGFPDTVIAPTRRAAGVAGTPQGPLWQINSTNRGATIADGIGTTFNAGQQYNPSTNINAINTENPGTVPSPGITLLPGAIPLFKANASGTPRLVGGVGVFVVENGNVQTPNVEAAEFAAMMGADADPTVGGDPDFFLDTIPLEGAITIVGVLLPYVLQQERPAGAANLPRSTSPAPGNFVTTFPSTVPNANNGFGATRQGRPDPFGYLIGPRAGGVGPGGESLSTQDVSDIIDAVVASADVTRAQVRLPLGSSSRVIATIVDTSGLILAHFRMEDTLTDAIDVVPAKARTTVYYCLPQADPNSAFANGDTWPGFPADPTGADRGIALTTRTLGFLSQPFYPPGIGGTADPNMPFPPQTPGPGNTEPGPLFNLALQNQLPGQLQSWGSAGPNGTLRNGLTFFPGSVPLYKNGTLVGALGVSGDGVEQNDLIALDAGRNFAPPPELLITRFEYLNVRLPYVKFPETPR